MRAQARIGSLLSALADLKLPPDHAVCKTPGRILHAADLQHFAMRGASRAGFRLALSIEDPYAFIEALLAFDGRASALLLLAPDLPPETVEALAAKAQIDEIISDRSDIAGATRWSDIEKAPLAVDGEPGTAETLWLLTTSGTTGTPKLVQHERSSILRGARPESGRKARWAMLYDPSRFAGTQVLAQALLSGATLLLPPYATPLPTSIDWLADEGCSHISATPSLWRRILMAPACARLPLRQITLGGEIADDSILSALRARFADARITHIYASTETGVGFSVQDGKAGFPAIWLDEGVGGVGMAVRDGLLWLRPAGGERPQGEHIERDDAGYICTQDRVELRGERYYFLGREDSSLNVGGIKVQVEAVEEVVYRHPAVAQCRISARPSPIMGNLLTLSVVPHAGSGEAAELRREIGSWCKEHLPRAAQPATIRIVDELPMTVAGKMERTR